MKRNYKSKSIKSILENFVEQENLVDGIFKGDILFIKVSNPILKQEILYSRQKVIDLINEDLGKEVIKKIVLK